ncbi:MAG: hypothetical protein FWE23_02540 [Chitinivibrionia bacterium]|nr:hypothetical protein [Chitinivibrionia bacterium]
MAKKIILFIFVIAFLVFSLTQPLDYWADEVEFSARDSVITLMGNSKIVYGSITLTADTITYFTNTRDMIATGNPVLIDGSDTLRGTTIRYNTQTRLGRVRHGLLASNEDATYFAQDLVRTDTAIYGHRCLYTTCAFPEQPHSHFYAEKIRIIPNDRAVARPFVLVIGDAPMVALPYFILPLNQNRQSGWLPIRWGVNLNGRGNVDNVGYYWAINDYLDFMLAGKVDNFETFLTKAETRYHIKDVLRGHIYTDFSITDQFLGHHNRWSLNFSHDQNLLPDRSFRLTGRGSMVSDRRYFTDFSDDTTNILNQNLSSNLALTKRFDEIGGHASLTWNRNQNLQRETIEQDLPTVNFSLSNRPLLPFLSNNESDNNNAANQNNQRINPLANLSWSYSYRANQRIWEGKSTEFVAVDSIFHEPAQVDFQNIHRGMSHSIPINMPFNIFRHIRITPNFTVNQAVFDSYIDTLTFTDNILVRVFDTISIDSINNIEYAGRDKQIIENPHWLFRDTTIVLVARDTIPREIRRNDTIFYRDPAFDINKAHQVWWNTGITLSTELFGIFPIRFGRMEGIRHTLSPSVGYVFTPETDLDVRFPSIGISSPTGTPRRQEIRFGINNFFETKIAGPPTEDGGRPTSRKINLLNANISGSYNFEADSQKLSNISLTAGIPAPRVNLSYSGVFHPYDMNNNLDRLRPLSHSINITPRLPTLRGNFWSGDMIIHNGFEEFGYLDNVFKTSSRDWNINITPRYTYSMSRPDIASEFRHTKHYNMSAGFGTALSERWRMNWSGTWSFTENKFINQGVSITADLECWDLRLDWHPSGVNEGRIFFVASLKRHRDLRWEQRER